MNKGDIMKRLAVVGLSALTLTGCIPKMHTVSPQIEGKVVDAKTGKPLSGVHVGTKQTDQNGKFIIEGKKKMGIGTPMGGVWRLPTLNVPISKKGYKSTYYSCSSYSNVDGCTNLTISLTPLDK